MPRIEIKDLPAMQEQELTPGEQKGLFGGRGWDQQGDTGPDGNTN